MSKLLNGNEICDRCDRPYIAALNGKSCECASMVYKQIFIDPTQYPCYMKHKDSPRNTVKTDRCIGVDKCNNKGCPLVQDRIRDERGEE